jgi:glycosyltransferase involved in cell wall biosynthesis
MKKPLRVLIVVTKMCQGGAIVLPLQLASALRDRGHNVETWFLYKEEAAYENDAFVRLMLTRRARGPLDHIRILWRLVRAMREYRPDAVCGVLPLGNIFGLLCARFVGCQSRIASQHTPAYVQKPIMLLLDKLLGTIGFYSENIAVSHSVNDTFKRYPLAYRNRLRVIQNGVLERPIRKTKAEARDWLGLPQEAFTLGTVGRLSPEKNHGFLLDLTKCLPGIHLAIVGSGDLEADYRRRIQSLEVADRVHLLGPLPVNSIQDFLATVDVFVLPSKFEGLPVALVEAMQAGLPIIASDISPIREVVLSDSGLAAQMESVESVDSWVPLVRTLQSDPAARQKLSDAAKSRAKAFSIERMVEGYMHVLTNGARGA